MFNVESVTSDSTKVTGDAQGLRPTNPLSTMTSWRIAFFPQPNSSNTVVFLSGGRNTRASGIRGDGSAKVLFGLVTNDVCGTLLTNDPDHRGNL